MPCAIRASLLSHRHLSGAAVSCVAVPSLPFELVTSLVIEQISCGIEVSIPIPILGLWTFIFYRGSVSFCILGAGFLQCSLNSGVRKQHINQ